jgi:TPR repeat protein
VQLYLHGLQHEDFLVDNKLELYYIKAIYRLSIIYKRQGSFHHAVELWERAAEYNFIDAHIELAKYYEHRSREYPIAIQWTERAITILQGDANNQIGQQIYLEELQYRLSRLIRKTQRYQ